MHDGPVVSEVTSAPTADSTSRSRLSSLFQGSGRNIGLALALVLALLILAIFSPRYFSFANFVVIALQMSFIGILALGTAMLIISGNVDLSIGAMYGLTAVIAAMLAKVVPAPLALLAGILLAGALGWLNGAMVWRVKLSPIIITLGSLTALRGVILLITNGAAVRGVPEPFTLLGQARPFDVPMPVWLLFGLALIIHFVLSKTTLGRYFYAIGGNREASEAAGLKVRSLVLGAFAVNGLIVGLSSVLAASRYGTASPSFGVGFEFDVITAVILGGVRFTGGEGNILGVMLAVALLGVINSGLVSLGVNPFWTEVVKGVALIVAVGLDQITHEQRQRRRTQLAMQERDRSEPAGTANSHT